MLLLKLPKLALPGTLRQWALAALALHVLGALLSSGFYHPDEQFQVLEFMNMKLGRGALEQMPIEYAGAMRSWVQPGFLLLVNNALEAVGIADPFARATVFRLLAAVLGWATTVALVAAALPRLKTQLERGALVVLSTLLWYLPSLHARTSSENWSGAIFFLGLSATLLLAESARKRGSLAVFAGAGALFGLAFGLRFQTAFLSIGAFAWWAVVGKAKPRELAAMVASGIAIVGFSAMIDRWGYGYWTSTAWNYFRYTLVEGHVNDSGTGPLWDYVRMSFTESWPLLGTLVFASFFVACYRDPKSPFVWSAIPLVAIHHLIAHKELRFLFPIAHAGPLWVALAVPLVAPLLLRALFGYNVVALLVQSCVPAQARIPLWKAISASQLPTLYYRGTDDPHGVTGLTSRFYRPAGLVTGPAPADEELARAPGPFLLYHLRSRGEPSSALLANRRCEMVARQLPESLEKVASRFPNIKLWRLLRCD